METYSASRQDIGQAATASISLEFQRSDQSIVKRSFDLVLASILLICSLPILIAAAIAIVVEDAGSPLFLQRRVGKNGNVFKIFKLRTMYARSDNSAFKTVEDDQRLTSAGKFLRTTNVDELPQLINIICGDMSFIGPRPLSVDETSYICKRLNLDENYPGLVPHIRPGLIGLEQINRDKELTYLDRFAYNHDYETNWSGSMDLFIFLKGVVICRSACIAACAGAAVVLASLVGLGGM